MARFHAASQLSDRLVETPEGFLVCLDVALARTGALEYLADEVPEEIAQGQDRAIIYRLAEDLLAEEALASFEGKPFVVGHPDGDVRPDNWRQVAAGHVQNVRRGTGADADLMLADLVVTAPEAIQAIKGGLREVSNGYDADYEIIAPGVGRQIRISGNHVALVEAGRCGPRCAIRDEDRTPMTTTATAKRGGFLGFVLGNTALRKVIDADPKAKRALDEEIAALAKEKDADPDPKPEEQTATDQGQQMADDLAEMKILLRSLLEKLDGASGADPAATDQDPDKAGDEDPDKAGQDEDPEKKTVGDRAARPVADQRLVQDAAVLAPALRARVGDSAPVIKRSALRQACADKVVDRVVRAALGAATVDTASGAALDAAFAVATEMVRARSNAATADALTNLAKDKAAPGKAVTPADLNAMFADHRKTLGMGA